MLINFMQYSFERAFLTNTVSSEAITLVCRFTFISKTGTDQPETEIIFDFDPR